ncbi:MAG: hypothetical protein LBS86_02810 [Treponema sp.]|nr:hypothetical protein [Treponema sp.]
MSGQYFYPRKKDEFRRWGAVFVSQVQSYNIPIGLPVSEYTVLAAAWAKYIDAELEVDVSDYVTSTIVKQAARLRLAVIEEIKRIKNGYIDPSYKLKKITAEMYASFGLRLPATTHTPKGNPTDYVEFELKLDARNHLVSARFRVAGSRNWSKGHYHAVEVRYWIRAVSDPAPVDADAEGWSSEADSSSPWDKTFSGDDAGKRLWVAMRWENPSTGKGAISGKGPWSGIIGTIIP